MQSRWAGLQPVVHKGDPAQQEICEFFSFFLWKVPRDSSHDESRESWHERRTWKPRWDAGDGDGKRKDEENKNYKNYKIIAGWSHRPAERMPFP